MTDTERCAAPEESTGPGRAVEFGAPDDPHFLLHVTQSAKLERIRAEVGEIRCAISQGLAKMQTDIFGRLDEIDAELASIERSTELQRLAIIRHGREIETLRQDLDALPCRLGAPCPFLSE